MAVGEPPVGIQPYMDRLYWLRNQIESDEQASAEEELHAVRSRKPPLLQQLRAQTALVEARERELRENRSFLKSLLDIDTPGDELRWKAFMSLQNHLWSLQREMDSLSALEAEATTRVANLSQLRAELVVAEYAAREGSNHIKKNRQNLLRLQRSKGEAEDNLHTLRMQVDSLVRNAQSMQNAERAAQQALDDHFQWGSLGGAFLAICWFFLNAWVSHQAGFFWRDGIVLRIFRWVLLPVPFIWVWVRFFEPLLIIDKRKQWRQAVAEGELAQYLTYDAKAAQLQAQRRVSEIQKEVHNVVSEAERIQKSIVDRFWSNMAPSRRIRIARENDQGRIAAWRWDELVAEQEESDDEEEERRLQEEEEEEERRRQDEEEEERRRRDDDDDDDDYYRRLQDDDDDYYEEERRCSEDDDDYYY